jgi:nitrous oxide reductase accessory protein NosL
MIERRRLLLGCAAGALLALPLAGLLAGCGRAAPADGPLAVRWGRDTCTRCQMVLSDRRFAAEVRGGPRHELYKFDDIGCAVAWLNEQPWSAEPATRIWVAALASQGEAPAWLDARRAHYQAGYSSPMGYNFGAVAAATPASLDFQAMRQQALARGY